MSALTFCPVDLNNSLEIMRCADIRRLVYAESDQKDRFEEKFKDNKTYEDFLKQYAENNPDYVFWALQNHEIVGHGVLKGSNEEWRDGDGYVDIIFVDREHRGLGLGKTILDHSEALLLKDNFSVAWLNCVKANTGNMKFYQSQGWTQSEDHPSFPTLAIWEKKLTHA